MKFWIVGPTASGKTAFSIMLSNALGLPIVNCDSRQFWRDLKNITCSPSEIEMSKARHLLFDELSMNERPNLGWWCDRLKSIEGDYILVGGTVFYGWSLMRGVPIENKSHDEIECYDWSVLNEMSPEFAATVHANDAYRVNRAINFYRNNGCMFTDISDIYKEDLCVIKLIPEKSFLLDNVTRRVVNNLDKWITEVDNNRSDVYKSVIGYQECIDHINGSMSYEELSKRIIEVTMQYVRRQLKIMRKVNAFATLEYGYDYVDVWNSALERIIRQN